MPPPLEKSHIQITPILELQIDIKPPSNTPPPPLLGCDCNRHFHILTIPFMLWKQQSFENEFFLYSMFELMN